LVKEIVHVAAAPLATVWDPGFTVRPSELEPLALFETGRPKLTRERRQ
jgi:hypothetical protein